MTNTLRIKRRAAGGVAGAPSSLANAELAYNEQDDTLYYGKGTGGAGGTATAVIPIGGPGAFAPLANPALTGTPSSPTAAADTNTTQIATTAFVVGQAGSAAPLADSTAAVGTSLRYARQDHVHPTDTSRAALASPTFTGTPAAPTAAVDTSTTQLATTAFVLGQAGAATPLGNGVAAVGTSTRYARADHVHPTDTSRAALASPTFTGTPAAPTAAADTNTTQVATTAFVLGQASAVAGVALGTAAVGISTRYARADHVHAMPTLSQVGAPTAAVAFNSQRITGLADPTQSQDAATKNYVDLTIQGLDPKQSVRAATTANIATLSGTMTIDGVALVVGNRVLVKDQTTASQNGVYVVAAGAWTRADDLSTWEELVSAYLFVEQGSTNADNGFLCTVDAGGTLGSTAVTFVQFNGAGQIVAGNGLSKSGSTLSVVGTANRITVSGSVDIASTYVGQSSITTLGTITTGVWNGTSIAVANGGTGATTSSAARTNLGLSIGTDVQAYDAELAAIAGLTSAADRLPYFTGSGTAALATFTTFGRSLVDDADAAAGRTTLGLGTIATQDASNVAITGGTIGGTTIDGGTF